MYVLTCASVESRKDLEGVDLTLSAYPSEAGSLSEVGSLSLRQTLSPDLELTNWLDSLAGEF